MIKLKELLFEISIIDSDDKSKVILQSKDWYLERAPKVGDIIIGDGSVSPGGNGVYLYKVLDVESGKRFGKDNYILTVEKMVFDPERHNSITDSKLIEKTKVWANQLF